MGIYGPSADDYAYGAPSQQETPEDYLARLLAPGGEYAANPQAEQTRQALLNTLSVPDKAQVPFTPGPLSGRQKAGAAISGLADIVSAIGHARSRGIGQLTDYTGKSLANSYLGQREKNVSDTEQYNLSNRAKKFSAGVAITEMDRKESRARMFLESYRKSVDDARDALNTENKRWQDYHTNVSKEGITPLPGESRTATDERLAAQAAEEKSSKLGAADQRMALSEERLRIAEERLGMAKDKTEGPDKVQVRKDAETARKGLDTFTGKIQAVSSAISGSAGRGVVIGKGDKAQAVQMDELKQRLMDAYQGDLGRDLTAAERIKFNDLWDRYVMIPWSKAPAVPG